jgi:DNA-binding MarR family transcriptional regulator
VVGLIDRLKKEKFVLRSPSKNRRKVLIRHNLPGEKARENISTMHRKKLNRIGPELSRLAARLEGDNP